MIIEDRLSSTPPTVNCLGDDDDDVLHNIGYIFSVGLRISVGFSSSLFILGMIESLNEAYKIFERSVLQFYIISKT